MTSDFNDALFDTVLQKAFYDYEKEQISSYPDDVELSKMYPVKKSEIRSFNRAVKELKYGKSVVRVYLSRAAVVFLCIIALGSAVIMTSPTVRAAVRDVIIEWFDKYTSFTILSSEPTVDDFTDINDVEIGYVPSGFELVYTDELPGNITYIYSSSDGKKNYTIDFSENNDSIVSTDNEYSAYEKINIKSREAWIVYRKKEHSGSIILIGNRISVLISGNLPKNELIKIAENIK